MAKKARSTAKFLKYIDLFSLLSIEEIEILIEKFEEIKIDKGTLLFKEGDKGDRLYIVKTGKVKVLIDLPDGTKKEIASSGYGDFFGEMSLFETGTRSASCVADEDSVLFSLLGSDFFDFVHTNPDISIKIMYKMLNTSTKRLKNSSGFLSDIVQWGENARRRSITDELTGLYNRRFMDDVIHDKFKQAKKKNESFSLMMIDMDHFRDINDNYGFEAGDKAILGVSEVYKNILRDQDIICRYGGDEFTVLLPETAFEKAFELGEEICKNVANSDILKRMGIKDINISLSIGLAVYPENSSDVKSLKEFADKALYKAKEDGRNRCVFIQ